MLRRGCLQRRALVVAAMLDVTAVVNCYFLVLPLLALFSAKAVPNELVRREKMLFERVHAFGPRSLRFLTATRQEGTGRALVAFVPSSHDNEAPQNPRQTEGEGVDRRQSIKGVLNF